MNRKKYLSLLLATAIALAACSGTVTPPSVSGPEGTAELPEAPETPEATEAPAPPETTEATDAPEQPDTTAAAEDEPEDNTGLIIALVVGLVLIGLLAGWIFAHNREDAVEDNTV